MKTKNETTYNAYIDTPVGAIKIEATDRLILSLTFAPEAGPSNPNDLCEEATEALRAYFSGKRKTFDLPLKEASSAFAKKVYAETKKIPFGERRCYGDINPVPKIWTSPLPQIVYNSIKEGNHGTRKINH